MTAYCRLPVARSLSCSRDICRKLILMQKSFYSLLIALFLSQAWANKISFDSGKVPMKWMHYPGMPYAVLLIPVELDGTSYYMQFDLGATKTVFYEDAPTSLNFNIGASKVHLDSLRFRDLKYNSEQMIIGTLGMDLLESCSLELNFKEAYFHFNLEVTDFATGAYHYVQQKLLLPSFIEGQSKMLVFDSGSSAFDFITDKETWDLIRDSTQAYESFQSKSWGETVTVHIAPARMPISMVGKELSVKKVAYVEGISEARVEHMTQTGMGGMVGNTLFLQEVLYFDFKRRKFGFGT